MNDNTEDMDWLNDYPALKKLPKDNPFLVPQNYFEEQQAHIRTTIFAQNLQQDADHQGFAVPPNYFEKMQNQLLSVVKLENIASSKNSFTVPDQFFEDQQSNIASRIIIDEFAGQEDGFTVPDQFFDIQTGHISSRIIIDEFAGDQRGFTVPANYFEDLEKKITDKTSVKEALPAAASVRKLFIKAIWKYATAACIAIAVVTGIVIKQNQPVNVQSQLSNLPDADIENYLKINADTYDSHMILETSASETNDSEINQKDSGNRSSGI